MIRCHYRHLEDRCKQRGFSWDEILPCIVDRDGDYIIVDETNSAYPRKDTTPTTIINKSIEISPPVGGPGTELKILLENIGIKSTPTCSCNKRAKIMDDNGIDWCETNIDTIVGWLKEEAQKRNLPFIDLAGKILVKKAISNARKKFKN